MNLRPTGPLLSLTLRGMLVITALVAIGTAFVGTKVRRARDERQIAAEILRSGGSFFREIYGVDPGPSGVERTWFERLIDLDLEARIVHVRLAGPEVKDATLAQLAGLTELRQLDLENLAIDGTGLAALARLPKLTHIDIRNCALSDDGVAAIAQLPAIESLSIDRSIKTGSMFSASPTPQVSGASLGPLTGLKSLKHLTLGSPCFTDDNLRPLAGAGQIEELVLRGTDVTDDGLTAMLDRMTGLRSVAIYNALITGPGLAKLRDCPRLLELRVQGPLDDAGLAHLAEVTQLGLLQIAGASGLAITDEGLAHLGKLTNLTRLSLTGSRFGDEGLRHLAGLTSLAELQLYPAVADFTDEGLAHLESLVNLRSLCLSQRNKTVKFSPAAIEKLQRAVPGVTVQR
jgi:hypothetical protein